MNTWIVGAFYTEGTPYKEVAEEYLLKSCDKFKLEPSLVRVHETHNFGNWNRNVAEKPKVILDMLENMPPEECLVFLDADATIEQYPMLFDTIASDIEFACHYLNWNQWYGYDNPEPIQELLSGTLFLRNTPTIKRLCKEWHEQAIKDNRWEQKVLQDLLIKYQMDMKVMHLPLSYCYMISRPGGRPPLVQIDPVILHHQVSRELKRKV